MGYTARFSMKKSQSPTLIPTDWVQWILKLVHYCHIKTPELADHSRKIIFELGHSKTYKMSNASSKESAHSAQTHILIVFGCPCQNALGSWQPIGHQGKTDQTALMGRLIRVFPRPICHSVGFAVPGALEIIHGTLLTHMLPSIVKLNHLLRFILLVDTKYHKILN